MLIRVFPQSLFNYHITPVSLILNCIMMQIILNQIYCWVYTTKSSSELSLGKFTDKHIFYCFLLQNNENIGYTVS